MQPGKKLLAGILAASIVLGFSLASLAWSLYAATLLNEYRSLYNSVFEGLHLNASTIARLRALYGEALRLRPFLENATRLLEQVNISRLEAMISEARRLLYSPEVDALEELLRLASGVTPEAGRALRLIEEARRLVSEAQPLVEELKGLNMTMVRRAAGLLSRLEETLPPYKLEELRMVLEKLEAGGGLRARLEGLEKTIGFAAAVSAAALAASAVVLAVLMARLRLVASR